MKIPFDIKYRPQIESGEYKVETSCGLPARIICWDRLAKKNTDDDLNLCVLVSEDEGEAVYYYHSSGKKWVPYADYDLFIITPEEELTEFEKVVRDAIEYDPETSSEEEIEQAVRGYAEDILELAKKEALKDLPRWIDDGLPKGSGAIDISGLLGFDFIRRNGKLLRISNLEKLPGFKED